MAKKNSGKGSTATPASPAMKKTDVVKSDAKSPATSTSSSLSSSFLFSSRAALLFAILAIVVSVIGYYYERADQVIAPPPSPPKKLTKPEIVKRAKGLPCKDRHDASVCTQMAANGDCDTSPGWMTVMCAASCNRCKLLDPKLRCSEENMKIKFEDAYKPGDMNQMFQELIARTDVETEVLKTKPYMVLVKNFISEEESSTLLALTEKGLKRSTDQGAIAEDGFQEQVVSEYRTSSNSWCDYNCEAHPVVKNLMERISNLIKIPYKNFEAFQVLRYEKTQKYDVHHDGSTNDFKMAAGPRVLTFFMYLSDVEEGGETHFPRLNVTVKPSKGSALLWPSVQSDFPGSKIEDTTFHAALPVKRGLKYAANSWIHLRDYKTPNLWGCTGSFD